MEALILDTSVLIGLLDSEDTHHHAAVEAVERADLERRGLITPASAYSEALVAFARASRLEQARDALAGIGITVAPMSSAIAERAASLRAHHDPLRLPDAIVLATALDLDGELMSYDHRLAKLAGPTAKTSNPPDRATHRMPRALERPAGHTSSERG